MSTDRQEQKQHKENDSTFWRFIGLLPIAVPATLASFGTVAVALLIVGQFRGEYVWPLGLLAALIITLVILKHVKVQSPGNLKERRAFDIIVLLAVLAWTLFGGMYTAQHVFTDRDPSAYANTAAWIVDNQSLPIDAPRVFGEVEGLHASSAGFGEDHSNPQNIRAHGLHLLSTLIGVVGEVVGTKKMLTVVPVFGGAALLAMYAFARLIIRPAWATVAVAAIGVSLPMIYFSRDAYTESLLMAFTFGGLATLWHAQKSMRKSLWFLTGVLFGAATMARIDGWLVVMGVFAFWLIFLAVCRSAERKTTLSGAAAFVLGFAPVAAIGLVDLFLYSAYYPGINVDLLYLELIAIAGLLLLGVLIIALSWRTRMLHALDKATKNWRAPAIAILVIVIGLSLAARPIFYTDYASSQNKIITNIQERTGDPVEPRGYTENSVEWISWYIGPALVVLGFVGLAYSARSASQRKDLLLVAGVLVIGVSTILYLARPSITPDQIWAARRFMPIAMPGLAIFGVLIVSALYDKFLRGLRAGNIFAILLATYIILVPLLVSKPFFAVRPLTQLSAAEHLCDALPNNAAVVWVGIARLEAVMPTRSYCNVPAVGYAPPEKGGPEVPNSKTLANIAQNVLNQGYVPIIGVWGHQKGIFSKSEQSSLTLVAYAGYNDIERTVRFAPDKVVTVEDSLLIAEIRPDGNLRPADK